MFSSRPFIVLALSDSDTPAACLLSRLFRRSNKIIFRYEYQEGPKVYERQVGERKVTLYNDTVIAYGQDDKELFRTTIEEPVHVRPNIHANSI